MAEESGDRLIIYLVRRLVVAVPTLIGITFLTFVLTYFVPGGPVEHRIAQSLTSAGDGAAALDFGSSVPADAKEEMKAFYGFDKPLHQRYASWVWKVMRFDFGRSYVYQESVWQIISDRLPLTAALGLAGIILSYLLCIPLGILKAVRHGSRFDLFSSVVVLVTYSIPGWAFGTFLVVLLGGYWNVIPSAWASQEKSSWLAKSADQLKHLSLPVICYTIESFATLTMLAKNSLIETLGQEYIRTAYSKGVRFRHVIVKHALRNAMIPLISSLGRAFSVILAGSFLIERVFNIDGMGYLGYTSILQHDYPVVLGLVATSSLSIFIANLSADILYAAFDPRIRFR